MSRKWIFIAFIAFLGLLTASALLYMRLGKWNTTVSLPTDSGTATACGQPPKFEFLRRYQPTNLAGGSFSFEKIGHLCLEQIEPVSGQELLLYLTYNTGTSYERITLPARIIVSTQVDPSRPFAAKVDCFLLWIHDRIHGQSIHNTLLYSQYIAPIRSVMPLSG
jgi:hypothetical protein